MPVHIQVQQKFSRYIMFRKAQPSYCKCHSSLQWLCDVCGDLFADYPELESHAKKKHRGQWNNIIAGPTPFDMEYSRLLRNLAREHLVVRDEIPSDGNCQFAAVADQLERIGRGVWSHQDLRRMAVDYIRNNPVLPGPDPCRVADFVDGQDLDGYLQHMGQEGVWGDHLTLLALTNCLHVRVQIMPSSSGNPIILRPSGVASSTDVILLGHIAEEHYLSVEPGEQTADGEQVWDVDGYEYSGPDDLDSSTVSLPDIPQTRNCFEVLKLEEDEDNEGILTTTSRQRRRQRRSSPSAEVSQGAASDVITISDDSEAEDNEGTLTTTSRQRRRQGRSSPSDEVQSNEESLSDSDWDGTSRQPCHGGITAIFHGRKTAVTNLEVLDLLSSQERTTHCTNTQVTQISCNASFLIDISAKSKVKSVDAHVDAMGGWQHVCTKKKEYSVKGITLKRISYCCNSEKTLKKAVVRAIHVSGEELPYVFVQYRFLGEPCQINRKPHGNSKQNATRPYVRCNPSTIEMFKNKKEVDPIAGPSKICYEVTKAVGSSTGVDTPCKLPRGRKQVTDIIRKSKDMQVDDPVYRALSFMQEEGPEDRFFQNIIKSPCSSIQILYNARQINDISTFCTIENPAILGADITFKCGPFWVLATSYTHSNLLVKGTNVSPTMIGPMALVQDKNKESYLPLFQKIVSEKPELRNTLRAFGTDGETNLIESLKDTFPNAKGYRCTIHLWKNIKNKCQTFGITPPKCSQIVDELKYLCLNTEHFENDYAILKDNWIKLADSSQKAPMTKLLKYLEKNIVPVLKDNVLVTNNKNHYLYTQNACESLNAMLKRWASFRSQQIDTFIKDIKDFVLWQEENAVQAYLGMSAEWEVRDKNLQKTPEWLINDNIKGVTRAYRKKQLLFMGYSCGIEENEENLESVKEIEDVEWGVWGYAFKLNETGLSETMIKGVILKAKNILDSGMIRKGFNDPKERIVNSESSSKYPHCVKPMKSGGFKCDCQGYKASTICAHTLATACDCNDLVVYVDYIVSKCIRPNLTPLCAGKASNPGRKKPISRKRKRNSPTRAIVPLKKRSTQNSISPKPWLSSNAEWYLINYKTCRARLCAGCREEYKTKKPPPNDVLLRHWESDFKKGTRDVALESHRYYHVDFRCLRRRHPTFDPIQKTFVIGPRVSSEQVEHVEQVLGHRIT
ncbi:uncharacterized protein [Branchiostoma lanceolatum]|uniref:uncharacterized protein isoform X2 n=1 Tax=Branchiostoma lanceolatum TaxID=7740 RepID=UPI0034527F33